MGFAFLLNGTESLLIRLLAVVIYTPIFVIPGAVMGIVGGWAGHMYMRAQLPIKREMSNAKAPVLGHFGAAIAGLSELAIPIFVYNFSLIHNPASIRAYGAQEAFKQQSLRRIDLYSRTARAFYSVNWYGRFFMVW